MDEATTFEQMTSESADLRKDANEVGQGSCCIPLLGVSET